MKQLRAGLLCLAFGVSGSAFADQCLDNCDQIPKACAKGCNQTAKDNVGMCKAKCEDAAKQCRKRCETKKN